MFEKHKNDPLKSLTKDKLWAKQWLLWRTAPILLWVLTHFGSGMSFSMNQASVVLPNIFFPYKACMMDKSTSSLAVQHTHKE